MKEIEEAIVKTLAYFDAFDRPLTKEELGRWMWMHDHLITVSPHHLITELPASDLFEYSDGYLCLKGRSEIIPLHQARVWVVEKKMKIAVRAAKKMRWVPFVRGVFVSNTVAMGGPREESDVDFFVVVKDGHLWLSRFLITLLLGIFRLRRNKRQVENRACLCFYTTDASLDLSSVKLFPDEVYLMYWIDQLLPVYDPHRLSERLCKENAWVRAYLPHALVPRATTGPWRVNDPFFVRWFRRMAELLFSWAGWERDVKALQQWKMKKNTGSVQRAGDTRVVISDRMLKFHENDRRKFYYEEWRKKVVGL